MALDFPASPSLNDVYQSWVFDGEKWIIPSDPAAPFVSKAGDTMAGPLEVMFGTPPGDDDATNKKYVDDAIASGALYQGTWVALTNVPDLTGTAHQNGWAWVVITSDPHVNEATGVAIPGLPAGTMVGNGDRVVWNAGSSEFELIHSPGMTQTEADDRYLQLAGGTMTAVTGAAGGGTGITIANSSAVNAIALTNTGTGAGLNIAVSSGNGVSATTTGTGTGLMVANNGTGTGLYVVRGTTAGSGVYVNFANAGVAGTALAISNGPPVGAIGLSIGSATEGNSALQISRWTPDTSVRLLARHDGSLATTVDTTSPNLPLDIRTTTANNPAVSKFSVTVDGAVTAQAGANVAATSGGLVVGSATNTAAQLSVRGQVNLSTDAGGVYLGTTAYPATVWSYGAGNLAMQSGTVTIGTATNNDPQPTAFVSAPPGGQNARPLLTGHDNTTWAQAPFTWRIATSTNDGIKIRLPYSLSSNVMFAFTVRVFSNYHHADLNFSGYLYTGASTFYMPLATCSDSTVAGGWRVIMGLDSDNRGYVYIKAERTGFSWGGICVCNVLAPYGGANFRNGWELVRVPTLDTTIAPNRVYDRNVDFYNGTFFNYANDITFAPGWSFYIPQTPRLDFNGREVKFKATIQWQPSVVWPGGQNYLSPFAGPFGSALRPMTSHYMPATLGLPAGNNYATYVAVYPDGLFHIWLPAGAPNNTDGLCFVDCSWWTADGAPQRWGVGFNS